MGQVIHVLPEGQSVAGVTSLGDEVYILRPKKRDEVEVYDVSTYHLLRCLTVPNLRGLADMTICEYCRCMYISDWIVECIHRLELQGAATQWPVNDRPYGLSVNAARNVLVACDVVDKIKEFSTHGDLVRIVTLPGFVVNPWHAIQLTGGQFVLCHGGRREPVNRVCVVSADGRHIVHSHGGQPASDVGHYSKPIHLAVDGNEFVFVADLINRRVTLLSPTLRHMRRVVSCGKLKWWPCFLHLDVQRRRLYVTDNKWKDGEYAAGRLVVISV